MCMYVLHEVLEFVGLIHFCSVFAVTHYKWVSGELKWPVSSALVPSEI